jgi:succinate dehydrogenase / fumarate reductase, flavoprotein subunit
VPRKPQDPREPRDIPESERFYFLEERYPKYGNLLPRDIATREIFKVCIEEGLSVQSDRLCVYLDVSHLPRDLLDRKLDGILEIYRKFQGADPATTAMKIFPAVHYSMGGLWCDYEGNADGGLRIGSPRNQQTNVPGIFAIGECDYQFHGANRLGANSLVACVFSGLIVAPGAINYIDNLSGGRAGDCPASLFDRAAYKHEAAFKALLARPDNGLSAYRLHAELGQWMTKTATVVRRNAELKQAYDKILDLEQKAAVCPLSDTSGWANQDAIFLCALQDMFPLAKAILLGALARDECRGAHYKPEFAMPELTASDPLERRRQAEQWCDRFAENNRKWLKSTLATYAPGGDPKLSYEEIDTNSIEPRPRLYGVVGGELIEEAWKARERGPGRSD